MLNSKLMTEDLVAATFTRDIASTTARSILVNLENGWMPWPKLKSMQIGSMIAWSEALKRV